MKLLIVAKRILTAGEKFNGGVENYLFSLCKELSKMHDITIVCTSRDRKLPNYSVNYSDQGKVKIIKINRSRIPALNILSDPLYFIRDKKIDAIFNDILIKVAPDIVHIHNLEELSWNLPDMIKKNKIPLIFTIHEPKPLRVFTYLGPQININKDLCVPPVTPRGKEYFPKYYNERTFNELRNSVGDLFARLLFLMAFIKRSLGGYSHNKIDHMRLSLLKHALRSAALVIMPSKSLQKSYSSVLNNVRSMVVPLGVKKFPDMGRKDKKTVRFGYVGGLLSHKGINQVLAVFNRTDAPILIYGDDMSSPMAIRLAEKCRDKKNIRFMGEYRDMGKVLSNIDVLITPSVFEESYSLAAHEAFSAKIPVIATDHGAFPEYIRNGINGFLFNPGDTAQLGSIIKKISRDPGVLTKMRPNIPAVTTIKQHVSRMKEIYNDIKRKHPIK